MNNSEIEILKALRKNLSDATNVDWSYGYLDDWVDWAEQMKTIILNSVSIIDALVKDVEKSLPKTEEKIK